MSGTGTEVNVTIGGDASGFAAACGSAAEAMAQFRQIVQSFSVSLTEATTQMQRATPAAAAMQASSTAAAAAVRGSGAAARQAAVDYQAVIDRTTGVNRGFGSAADSAAVFERALGGAGSAAGRLRGFFTDAAEGAAHAAHGTAGVTRELLVMGHEAISGRFSRIPGSLMVLGERMGGLSFATLGWAAAIGAAVFTVYELAAAWLETRNAVEGAHDAMVRTGTLSADSDAQVGRMMTDMRTNWNLSRGDANALGQQIGSLGGTAAAFREQIAGVAAALDRARDGGKELAQAAVKAFEGGTESALRWATAANYLTEAERTQIEDMDKGGDRVGAMTKLLDELRARFVDSGKAAVQAGRQMRDALVLNADIGPMGQAVFGNQAPQLPSDQQLAGPPGTKAANPAEEDQQAVIDRNTAALHQRKQLLTELTLAQAAQARGAADAGEAIAAIEQKLATTHTASEEQQHQATMADLQGQLAAAQGNAAARVAIAQRIAAETTRYEGATSAAARQAAAQVTAAERQGAEEALRLKLAQISGEEAAAKGSASAEIAIEDKKLAVLRDAGKTGTLEYQQELNRRTSLERQAADQATAAELAKLRAQQEAARGNLGQQIAIQDRIVAATRAADGAESAQLAREVARREQLRQQEARQAADAAMKQLEDKRRLLDQESQGKQRHVQAQQADGQISPAAARTAELQIVAAHQHADAAILADETRTAATIEGLAEQVAQRKRELEQQTAQQIARINDQSAREQQLSWQRTNTQISDGFGGMVVAVVAHHSTMYQQLTGLGDRFLARTLSWALQGALDWAMGAEQQVAAEIAAQAQITAVKQTASAINTVTTAATASVDIQAKAASAAAGAYSAMSDIPVVGPALGAAAAAATYVAVLAYDTMFSAERGWGRVPFDGAVTTLHKNEMVLPAQYAEVIRGLAAPAPAAAPRWGLPPRAAPQPGGALASVAAAGHGAAALGTRGADMHLHYSPTVHAPAPRSLEQMLRAESGSLRRWAAKQWRNGAVGA